MCAWQPAQITKIRWARNRTHKILSLLNAWLPVNHLLQYPFQIPDQQMKYHSVSFSKIYSNLMIRCFWGVNYLGKVQFCSGQRHRRGQYGVVVVNDLINWAVYRPTAGSQPHEIWHSSSSKTNSPPLYCSSAIFRSFVLTAVQPDCAWRLRIWKMSKCFPTPISNSAEAKNAHLRGEL